MSVIRQPSLFGVDAAGPAVADLAGLLAAGATLSSPVRSAQTKAALVQLSVVVDHPWRAATLVIECARRGLAATTVSTVERRIGVRTICSALLLPLAGAWPAASPTGPLRHTPAGLLLDGRQLRLGAGGGAP